MTPQVEQLLPWIEYAADRASGPGGQNVNKVNTRISLLFDFATCTLLREEDKRRIQQIYAKRLSADGRLRIVSQSDRSQSANREAAGERLLELLKVAQHRPKGRVATRPSAASKRRRLSEKRRTAERKQGRSGGFEHE